MRLVHLTSSLSYSGGGVSLAVRDLAVAQHHLGLDVKVIGHRDQVESLPSWPNQCDKALMTWKIPGFPWAPAMNRVVNACHPSIIHTHGLWSQASIQALRSSASRRVPYLVSPHGMLDQWALANGKWKKFFARKAFEDRHLHGARCLHALCHSEAVSIRKAGFQNPIATIPNGVNLPSLEAMSFQTKLDSDGPHELLFLGRLHPKKGLLNALYAFAKVRNDLPKSDSEPSWRLVIAGWDQGGHLNELRDLCEKLKLKSEQIEVGDYLSEEKRPYGAPVVFVGPAFGRQKTELFQRASAFILPSFSEGLPISVLEAWSHGLPALLTDHCNLTDGFERGAALRIGTDPASIAEGLRALMSNSQQELAEMGWRGRKLVEERYSWSKVAAQMKEVYEWGDGSGERPSCVES